MRISKTKVAKIKSDLANSRGRDQGKIAKKHKVSRSLVSDINTGRAHKEVPWPEGYDPVPLSGKGQRKKTNDHDPTDRRIQELEGEVVHLAEELRLERRKAKAGAKANGLINAVVSKMEQWSSVLAMPPLPQVRKKWDSKKVISEHMVAHLSDGHHDQIVTPEECGGLETYNFPISCARAEKYVDTILKWTQHTLAPQFEFPVLNVLAYGDHTSGEIHGAVTRSQFKNQIKNCLAIGRLHGMMYRDLAPYFEKVNVVYVPGNHGRRSTKKDHHGAHDNWDYLIAKTAEMQCELIENVEFVIPNAFSVNLDINGVGFNIAHGDDVRSHMGIPFYGLQRRQKNLTAIDHTQDGPRVRYFCVGHFHQGSTLGDGDGELIVNGAWPATDAYSYNSFAGFREPSQWIHGVNEKYGITWRLKVQLRREREKLGPERYRIDVP